MSLTLSIQLVIPQIPVEPANNAGRIVTSVLSKPKTCCLASTTLNTILNLLSVKGTIGLATGGTAVALGKATPPGLITKSTPLLSNSLLKIFGSLSVSNTTGTEFEPSGAN
jgi:hypothetical protein